MKQLQMQQVDLWCTKGSYFLLVATIKRWNKRGSITKEDDETISKAGSWFIMKPFQTKEVDVWRSKGGHHSLACSVHTTLKGRQCMMHGNAQCMMHGRAQANIFQILLNQTDNQIVFTIFRKEISMMHGRTQANLFQTLINQTDNQIVFTIFRKEISIYAWPHAGKSFPNLNKSNRQSDCIYHYGKTIYSMMHGRTQKNVFEI